jgi:hypothetical protein
MQFFIALSILIVASSAYLLHQFWSRALSADDARHADASAAEDAPPPNRLKAA